jgi:signal transduction histidine kinase
MKFRVRLQTGTVIAVAAVTAIVMIVSAYIELRQSEEEIFHLLNEQANSLTEIITLSSINTLNSSFEIENLVEERLLNNARMLRALDSLNLLSRTKLIEIAKQNDLFRINIFDKKGTRILSNRVPEKGHEHPEGIINRYDELEPILSGKTEELVFGLKKAFFADEQRYAVAVGRTGKKGAIVINMNAEDFLEFRKKIGIGKIIQDMGDNSEVEYIVLQDSLGILAASGSVNEMSTFEEDHFLLKAVNTDSTFTRTANFAGKDVYEMIKSLKYEDDLLGVFRIGLSLDEVKSVEERMMRRIIIISVILAFITVIVLSIVFTTQNLKSINKEFYNLRNFTDNVLSNTKEVVLVVNKERKIILFNTEAEKFFGKDRTDVLNKELASSTYPEFEFLSNALNNNNEPFSTFEQKLIINDTEKFLSISINTNFNLNREIDSYTIIISDLTGTKNLEEQAKRNEKLTAMGELASGVAHEIRNPINSIGMIAQRLNKEFIPSEDKEEYTAITDLLRNEVTRINRIISQFLNYAKPLELEKKNINLKKFFEEIYRLFVDQAKKKGINLKVESRDGDTGYFDPALLKQALMNIIQNALDATPQNGIVSLKCQFSDQELMIIASDNGTGVPSDLQKRIFDLYYTTKKDGNGLGLSISQKIISEHGGRIELQSQINKETTFTIILPRK